jgi:hypothetical protein
MCRLLIDGIFSHPLPSRSVRALEVRGATKASARGGRVEAARGARAVSFEARWVARGDAVGPAGREARGAQNPRRASPRRETSSGSGMTLDGVNARLILALGATRRRGVVSPRARRVCAALAALCALVALANRLFPAVDETEATTPRRRLADYRALFLAGHLCFDYFVEPYAGPYFCLAPQPCFGGVDFVSCQRNSLARALQGTADSF